MQLIEAEAWVGGLWMVRHFAAAGQGEREDVRHLDMAGREAIAAKGLVCEPGLSRTQHPHSLHLQTCPVSTYVDNPQLEMEPRLDHSHLPRCALHWAGVLLFS